MQFSLQCFSDIAVDHQALLKQFEYLNHMNPHTFEVEDLDRLIKSVCLNKIYFSFDFTAHVDALSDFGACNPKAGKTTV